MLMAPRCGHCASDYMYHDPYLLTLAAQYVTPNATAAKGSLA